MTTVKLFEQDSHLKCFTATVQACMPAEAGGAEPRWEVALNQTAFFPEGGGQAADIGSLGAARVLDVREENGRILHLVDAPLTPGGMVAGKIDWDHRFPLMQLHSGEHIVSGLVRKHHGFDNVGFHMGTDVVTIDFNGALTEAELAAIETLTNEAIFANLPVAGRYPEPVLLKELAYRSKREIDGAVRVVSIPGCDDCACCGVHVKRTGEIGLVKLLSSRRYKGGTRVEMVAGRMALRDYDARHRQITAISVALSAKPLETAQAVARLQGEVEALRHELAGIRERQLAAMADSWLAQADASQTALPGNGRVLVEPNLTPPEVRKLVLLLVEQTQHRAREARPLTPKEGGRADWYVVVSGQYGAQCLYAAGVVATDTAMFTDAAMRADGAMRADAEMRTDATMITDARVVATHLRQACGARGGGAAGLVQGSAEVPAAELVRALKTMTVG
jgi:alanyl-tRNA synthetase